MADTCTAGYELAGEFDSCKRCGARSVDECRIGAPEDAVDDRPWLTGKPYYCDTCGLGGGEVLACEDGECVMESVAAAERRRDAARNKA